MCGIFFSIGYTSPSPSVIDSVTHRGPDGRGWQEFESSKGPVVMAHRRLTIIDLSEAGHQPMPSDDKRYWITYNGEIYNYLELRKELENLGHTFHTQTDTEVLLKSYIHWGEKCLDRFNGMFAFVIWDNVEKSFFAARDRFGVKPLYFFQQGAKLAIVSEIKQLTYLDTFDARLNQDRALDYFLGSYTNHTSETFFKDVYQLRGGEKIKIDTKTNAFTCRPEQGYDLKSIRKTLPGSEEELTNQFKELFLDAVRLRLRSDVSVGSCLSGGLDSSSIVCSVKHLVEDNRSTIQDFLTFSACYPNDPIDESKYIDNVGLHTSYSNQKIFPTPQEMLKEIQQVIYHHDQPIRGSTVYAQWCVFKKAAASPVKVMLDGQGADEIFAGYHSMFAAFQRNLLQQGNFITFFYGMKKLSRGHK